MARERIDIETLPQQYKYTLKTLQVLSKIEYSTVIHALYALDGKKVEAFFENIDKARTPESIEKVVNISRPAIKIGLFYPSLHTVELKITSKDIHSGTRTKTISLYPYKTLENGEENVLAIVTQQHSHEKISPTDTLKFVYKKDMLGNVEAKSYYVASLEKDTETEIGEN